MEVDWSLEPTICLPSPFFLTAKLCTSRAKSGRACFGQPQERYLHAKAGKQLESKVHVVTCQAQVLSSYRVLSSYLEKPTECSEYAPLE
jgi:hypothetical protein